LLFKSSNLCSILLLNWSFGPIKETKYNKNLSSVSILLNWSFESIDYVDRGFIDANMFRYSLIGVLYLLV